jgi:hypothetical protein
VQRPQIAHVAEFAGEGLGATRADGCARACGESKAGRYQAEPHATGGRRLCAALLVSKQLGTCIIVVQRQ